MSFEITLGVPADQTAAAAELYDEAFGAKLAPAIRDRERRLAVLRDSIDPAYGIAALSNTGELVGLAGFHDESGSLTGGGSFSSVRAQLGWFGAIRAASVIALLERKPQPSELLMDGIAVRADHRGEGVGSALFERLEAYCHEVGRTSIRLDVIDTNPDARRLYERLGFEATTTERVPFLRPIMGFSASTTMIKRL